jgi:hypothetical protein
MGCRSTTGTRCHSPPWFIWSTLADSFLLNFCNIYGDRSCHDPLKYTPPEAGTIVSMIQTLHRSTFFPLLHHFPSIASTTRSTATFVVTASANDLPSCCTFSTRCDADGTFSLTEDGTEGRDGAAGRDGRAGSEGRASLASLSEEGRGGIEEGSLTSG